MGFNPRFLGHLAHTTSRLSSRLLPAVACVMVPLCYSTPTQAAVMMQALPTTATANCGWSAGRWVLGEGGNGATSSATYQHFLGSVSAEIHHSMPRGKLWNYPDSAPHIYTQLFSKSDWIIENRSILSFSNTSKLNNTVLTLDLSEFPQEEGLVFGLENLATYMDNPYRYRLVLRDSQGNTVAPTSMHAVGTEKSPSTGGNRFGQYDENVTMDSEGLLNVEVIGPNSLNTKGIFWSDIPANVASIQINVEGATAYYSDFVRLYLGTPAYCPPTLDIVDDASSQSLAINEGVRAVTILKAQNAARPDSLSWRIVGGVDAGLFEIDNSGALSFKQAPDFENPQDGSDAGIAAADNVYVVEVETEDAADGRTSRKTLSVTVNDVAPVTFSAKAVLRGAYENSSGLMRDDLRANNLLPLNQPYQAAPFMHAASVTLNADLLTTTGSAAIVDWVLLDFRQPENSQSTAQSLPLLLRRDGSVVDPQTGATTHQAELPAGNYFVSLRHRNHLGVITAEPLPFSSAATTTIDFSSNDLSVRGDNARYWHSGSNTFQLWAGDADQNQAITLNGVSADQQLILGTLMLAPDNSTGDLTYQLAGYLSEDLNLDGVVSFDGSALDETQLLMGTASDHPGNTVFVDNAHLVGEMAAH